jgi:hypothetical protein
MTTEQSAGAASNTSVHWRHIDRRTVNESVRRLQVRIVKGGGSGQMGQGESLTTAAQNVQSSGISARAVLG